MTVLVILVVCALSTVFAAPSNENAGENGIKGPVAQPHIVGGDPAKKPIPYQVSLRFQREVGNIDASSLQHLCGGAFITKDIVLTAAHCVSPPFSELLKRGRMYVVGGTHLLNYDVKTAFISAVARAEIHPEYNNTPNAKDIAVLKLRSPYPDSGKDVSSIDLRQKPVEVGHKCNISGWGTIKFGKEEHASEILRFANVPVVSRDECKRKYSQFGLGPIITEDMLCAGYEQGGIDSCQGDSGGPLVCYGELAGIVSWGFRCAVAHIPGVYADVTWFRQWILETIKKLDGIEPPTPTPTPTATPTPKPSSSPRTTVDLLPIAIGIVFFTRLPKLMQI